MWSRRLTEIPEDLMTKLDEEKESWPRVVGPIIPPDAENPRLVPLFSEAQQRLGWIVVIGPPFPAFTFNTSVKPEHDAYPNEGG
jgi:hypothetical protein